MTYTGVPLVTVFVDVEMCRYDEQNGVAVLTAETDLTMLLMALQTTLFTF